MPLDIPAGTRCFLDANVIYYGFVDVPPFSGPCRALLQRIERGEVSAFTTLQCLADVVHKAMLAEVAIRFGQQRAGLVGWLKKHPEALEHLSGITDVARRVLALPLQRLPVDSATLLEAAAISKHCLLLTNDATIVAVMRQHRMEHLVTNDDDFGRAKDLTVWMPR